MVPAALCTADFFSGRALRLGLFVAASIALHAALIGGVRLVPLSGINGGEAVPRLQLEVTIRGEVSQDRTAESVRVQPSSAVPAPSSTGAGAAGGTTGKAPQLRAPASSERAIEVASAIKWYTAEELDVRAEPLPGQELAYPDALRGTRLSGKVRMRLFIDEHGTLRKLEIVASVPAGVFEAAAEAAWSSVRFTPARKNGAPVKSQKLIEVTYAPH